MTESYLLRILSLMTSLLFVSVVTAIVIVTVTSSVNDYSKEKQFKALSETKEVPEVEVLRDGKKYKV